MQNATDANANELKSTTELAQINSEGLSIVANEKVGIGFVAAVFLSMLISAVFMTIYHFYAAPKPVQFALLDVQKLSSAIENEARQAIVNNLEATPEQRAAAATTYENKLRSLQEVINKIGKDCDCVLLVKAAALNTNANKLQDFTGNAEKMLGLAKQ